MPRSLRIMAMTYIPSPEEIRLRLKMAEEGKPPPTTIDVKKLLDKVQKLEGRLDKRRSAKELREAMDMLMVRYDFSPAEELIKLVTEKNDAGNFILDAEGNKSLRVKILSDLLEYVQPKLKSTEVSGTVEHEHHHEITIIRYGDDGAIRKEKIAKVEDVAEVAA